MSSYLIYTGIYCDSDENREFVKLWSRVTRFLNPGVEIIALDSCSPFDPLYFIDPKLNINIVKYQDNPGHLSRGGGDGAGRTFCEGILMANDSGTRYCVHLESDLLLAHSLRPLIDKMYRTDVSAAACYLSQYQFFEFGICAMNAHWMREQQFVERYDWKNAPKWPIPERRIAELLDDDLWIIPWHGARNDQHQIKRGAINLAFPYEKPDWLTHCTLDVAHDFLNLHGLGHLA